MNAFRPEAAHLLEEAIRLTGTAGKELGVAQRASLLTEIMPWFEQPAIKNVPSGEAAHQTALSLLRQYRAPSQAPAVAGEESRRIIPRLKLSETNGTPEFPGAPIRRGTLGEAVYARSSAAVGRMVDGDKFLGTGFVLDRDLVATALRNIKDENGLVKTPSIQLPGEQALETRLLSTSNSGFAILSVDKPKSWLPFLEPGEPGGKTFMIGYPNGTKTPFITEGEHVGIYTAPHHYVNGMNQDVLSEAARIQTSNPTMDGLRGAPFLNARGEYVGINTALSTRLNSHGPSSEHVLSQAFSMKDWRNPKLPHVDFVASAEMRNGEIIATGDNLLPRRR
jgi:S1-C subfamily serine protease